MILYKYEDGRTMRGRGCLRGQANFTCTTAYAEKKQCTTLNNGEQVILGVLKNFL